MTQQNQIDREGQDQRLKERMQRIQHKIIILSGKGGVGKTTVSVNLAYKLALDGKKVGILDVDIHGPNIAKMLGLEGQMLQASQEGIEPVSVLPNLKAVSIAMLFKDADQPIIWRGPLKMNAIKQFLSDVVWGDLDYLIIDSPPGTGDEPLSACQLIPDISGAVVLTTPQDVSILDARKSVQFARSINVPVLGIIENMSGLVCPHCQKTIDLFGRGGGQKAALDLKVPFLGQLPMDPDIVKQSDSGKPFVASNRDHVTNQNMDSIVMKIMEGIKS